MGQDKAMMRGGVTRIQAVANRCGAERIITLCGDKKRASMFAGEVWPDPENCSTLAEVVEWAFSQVSGDIQWIPCDAFELDERGLTALLDAGGGVPCDSAGIRQPLLANCPDGWGMSPSNGAVSSLFSTLKTLDFGPLNGQMENANLPENEVSQGSQVDR
tara:strand:- start:308 stop:787 length:480 start_codon:yes stop_codon:yes gene_type:complete